MYFKILKPEMWNFIALFMDEANNMGTICIYASWVKIIFNLNTCLCLSVFPVDLHGIR